MQSDNWDSVERGKTQTRSRVDSSVCSGMAESQSRMCCTFLEYIALKLPAPRRVDGSATYCGPWEGTSHLGYLGSIHDGCWSMHGLQKTHVHTAEGRVEMTRGRPLEGLVAFPEFFSMSNKTE